LLFLAFLDSDTLSFLPPCPPKGGFVLFFSIILFMFENVPPFRGFGGRMEKKLLLILLPATGGKNGYISI
jgi:hypothetical protein